MNNWQIVEFDCVESTNDEIKKYCSTAGVKVAVRANRQTKGRGRCGRSWQSLEGNLFFSVAVEFDLQKIGHLVAITSLSLLQVIKKLNADINVELKWPNDVLLDEAKISGILLEKGEGDYIIIGIGVNIANCPESSATLYPTTSLAKENIMITAKDFMLLYLQQFEENMQILQKEGFDKLQKMWNSNAKNLHKSIVVKQLNKEEKGIFEGIDENANLLLKKPTGIQRILVGDVFFEEK